jgi:hypothetical protein
VLDEGTVVREWYADGLGSGTGSWARR